MKTKIFNLLLVSTILLLSNSNLSLSQVDSNYCVMNNSVYSNIIFPTKPYITGENYMRVLIVYVMFDDETVEPFNEVWPANTTTGPSYKGTMIASDKNSISDWWNAYNINSQSISSWFCENSRGQTYIIGDEYFVKLEHSSSYYLSHYTSIELRENAINSEIYENLNSQGVTWANFDKWTYNANTGEFSWGGDYNIDMIYKIHRYKYDSLFSSGNSKGYAFLGYGSNTSDPYVYNITQNGQIYHILGGFPNFNYYDKDGSGISVASTSVGGIQNKSIILGIITHEHGHYFYGNQHFNYTHMGYDEGSDYRFSPMESVYLNYLSTYVSNGSNSGYEEITLDDYSARTQNGKYIIQTYLPDDSYFLIANRNKISYWDRIMLGDTAKGDALKTNNYGQGVYIYHVNGISYDIECADGLWNWVQDGYEAPDWDPQTPSLPLLLKTNVVRNKNDDGSYANVNDYQNTAKDGRDIMGDDTESPVKDKNKWFSNGEKAISPCPVGIDRIYTTKEENWTSREFQGDRWDAWEMGYNEIFSPYSSPSTYNWSDSNSGIFIWIKEFNQTTKQVTIDIFRDGNYFSGGMSEGDILAATPPSRPMGLKTSITNCMNGKKYVMLTWGHNQEPDMARGEKEEQRYKVFRAYEQYGTVPGDYTEVADLLISKYDTPAFIDTTVWNSCFNGNYFMNSLRYKIKAIDNTDSASVYSDFAVISSEELNRQEFKGSLTSNNAIKEYKLSQNYPNPFNPTTKINFAIPKQGFLTLKIYDILGREIKTLVNEIKQAGNYTVEFNCSEFSSGVYFYRFESGTFNKTMRMLMIK